MLKKKRRDKLVIVVGNNIILSIVLQYSTWHDGYNNTNTVNYLYDQVMDLKIYLLTHKKSLKCVSCSIVPCVNEIDNGKLKI